MNPDIRKAFVLSTAHLTKETADKHSTYSDDAWLCPVPYGYISMFWDPIEADEVLASPIPPVPPELPRIIEYFRALGGDEGDYIRFDCDGEQIQGLPIYHWS